MGAAIKELVLSACKVHDHTVTWLSTAAAVYSSVQAWSLTVSGAAALPLRSPEVLPTKLPLTLSLTRYD